MTLILGIHAGNHDAASRSDFMPFAPVVLAERAEDVFELGPRKRYAARFMTTACVVRESWRGRVPAIVHLDGTARPQLIERRHNPFYYDVISAYDALSGVPVLVNTSFNAHEEPIVNTPDECARALLEGRVDFVATECGVYRRGVTVRSSESDQLAAVARLHDVFEQRRIEYWLFGGWAVDFHARAVTRAHDDIDIAVWLRDVPSIAAILEADGWEHAPNGDEDGYATYRRGGVHMDVAFLERGQNGVVYTPLRDGTASWPPGAFGNDVSELLGTRARVIALGALKTDKSGSRASPIANAKDLADSAVLARLS